MKRLEADDEAQERALAALLGEDPDTRVRRLRRKLEKVPEVAASTLMRDDESTTSLDARVPEPVQTVRVDLDRRKRRADERRRTALGALSSGVPVAVVARVLGITPAAVQKYRRAQ